MPLELTATSAVLTINQTLAGDQVDSEPFVYDVGGIARFGVVWTGDTATGADLFVRSIGARGFALGSELSVLGNRAGDQVSADVAVLTGGQTVLVWAENGGSGATTSIRALYGTPNGSDPFDAGTQVVISPPGSAFVEEPDVTALSNGSAAILFDRGVGADIDNITSAAGQITLRAADGMLISGPRALLPDATFAGAAAIGELVTGTIYGLITEAVFPMGASDPTDLSIIEQTFNGTTGAPLGAARDVSPGDLIALPQLIQLADGRLVGAVEVTDGGAVSLTYGSVSPWGVPQNDLALLSDRDTVNNETVSLAATPDGGFVAVWEADSQVVIRRFDIDLEPLGESALVHPNPSSLGFEPKVAVTNAGEVMVSWTGNGTGDDIFARTYTLDDLSNPGGVTRVGTTGNDRLTGTAADDTLTGRNGADVLDGLGGADVMSGGLGNDFYFVDTRADQIVGELDFSLGGGIDTVRTFVNYTQPENIELVRLGFLMGEADLSAIGNDAPGTLVGNAGDNLLTGRGGNDQLNGNNGDDTITGNTGRDTLVGGNGADTYIFTAYADSRAGASNRDVINGFERGAVTRDTIDLSQLDADTRTFGVDDAFTFIGAARFSGQAGELRTQALGGPNAVLIEADHNGDRVADLQIFVNLQTSMFAEDFVL